MTPRPYVMLHPEHEVVQHDTHGQSWSGETIRQSIELCSHQTIERSFRERLPKQGRILESGCGTGRWVFYLRTLGFDVVGIDLAEQALEAARTFDPTAPIFRDSVLRSTFSDGTFAAAISLGVVEHFEEGPTEALKELHRLLQEDGLLFISVPTQNLLRHLISNRLKELYRWIRRRRGMRFVFEEYRYTRSEFSAALRATGFEILNMIPDDLRPPKNMGLHVDFPFLRHGTKRWELNAPGRVLRTLLGAASPWWAAAGTHWICRKASSTSPGKGSREDR